MPERTIHIYEDEVVVQSVVDARGVDIIDDGANRVIEVIAEGPRGPVGPQGPAGFSGAGEPFFVVLSGSLYATTASLANLAYFSSSLNPWTTGGSTTFDVGSVLTPWRRVYVSESIFIVKSGSALVEIRGSENAIDIGYSRISTSSFGFEFPLFTRRASNQQTLTVQSASVSMSFDSSGVFSVPSFGSLPPPVFGGLVMFAGDLYVGN